MITVDQRGRIRKAYYIEKKSIRQIARELHHSCVTVRKAILSAEPESYTLTKPRPAPVLGPYMEQIDELLAENERLPKKQRRTGQQIYETICQEGYTGSASRVRGYIADQRGTSKQRPVYLPLEFDP
jgi:transposase